MEPMYRNGPVTIYEGRAQCVLRSLPPSMADCFIFSPPYYNKYDYDHPEQLGLEPTPEAYVAEMDVILGQAIRVTRPGGTLLLNIADTWNNYSPLLGKRRSRSETEFTGRENRRKLIDGYWEKELLRIPDKIKDAAKRQGFALRSIFAWKKGHSGDKKPSDRPRQDHEDILYFLKPAGRRRLKANYFDSTYLPSTVIEIPAVRSKQNCPCPWPEPLADKLIRGVCPPGGLVIDPFLGEGTTAIAAAKAGRRCIGIELSPKSCQQAIAAVSALNVGVSYPTSIQPE